jgi:hypothetical protein
MVYQPFHCNPILLYGICRLPLLYRNCHTQHTRTQSSPLTPHVELCNHGLPVTGCCLALELDTVTTWRCNTNVLNVTKWCLKVKYGDLYKIAVSYIKMSLNHPWFNFHCCFFKNSPRLICTGLLKLHLNDLQLLIVLSENDVIRDDFLLQLYRVYVCMCKESLQIWYSGPLCIVQWIEDRGSSMFFFPRDPIFRKMWTTKYGHDEAEKRWVCSESSPDMDQTLGLLPPKRNYLCVKKIALTAQFRVRNLISISMQK